VELTTSKLKNVWPLVGAAALAALLGSLTGEVLWFAISTFGDDVSQLGAADAVIIPLYIVGSAMVSFWIVFAGTVVLGIPLLFVLKQQVHRHWTAGIVVLLGGIAGWLTFRGISSGYAPDWQHRVRDIGVLYGAPAGLFWFLLARRFVGNAKREF
jgi:hypothetical protein